MFNRESYIKTVPQLCPLFLTSDFENKLFVQFGRRLRKHGWKFKHSK